MKSNRPVPRRINPFDLGEAPPSTLRKPPEETSWLAAPLEKTFTPARTRPSVEPRRGCSYTVSDDLFNSARRKKRSTRTSLSSVIAQGFRLWIAGEWQPVKRVSGERSGETKRSSSFAVGEALYSRVSQMCEDSELSMTSVVEQILEHWLDEK